ncbi:Zn-ribbon domain-containing OB-fold protein [Mesorhizobium sp. CO1-1-8]|uniref:Zn-ribbon domain-containing OB-fold protein n=1 Tax=Mesorhizobium sp. CO1-1-8 TaxID=2876631 RepID=UPI001CD0B54E|nr:OB-fold domain-containing protein [Mesorhizobium sp. CO1-1-8]MBZ9772384.1 OB-fold domain-containing protein [Mesorhizobium sp. CO1-1-8]
MKATALGRRGVVYTRTVIHAAAPGFEGPYVVGYVDVTEGIRVFAHLQTGEGAPDIGDPVILTLAPLRTDGAGRPAKGPRYRKAEGLESIS